MNGTTVANQVIYIIVFDSKPEICKKAGNELKKESMQHACTVKQREWCA